MSAVEQIGFEAGFLGVEARAAVSPELGSALRRLWVSALASDWKVLALVPAGSAVSLAEIARGLEGIAHREAGEPITLIDGTGTSLARATEIAQRLKAIREAGGRALVVVDAPQHEPAAVPPILCADAVVIGVRRGRTTHGDVARVRGKLGQARVLGAVLVEEEAR